MKIAVTYNEKRSADEREAEYDTRDAIAAVARLVASLGHSAVPVDVTGSIPRLASELQRLAPDLVFNFAEGERGAFREAFYPALFEQLGIPHTGSSASTLAVCMDKALAKKVVSASRVRVPRGRLVRKGDPLGDLIAPLIGPVIVKPNLEGSSIGITGDSVVADPRALPGAVAAALARFPGGVLVEDLVPGIDVGVGWVAGVGLLPPIAYRFDGPIYDYALKHEHPERVAVEIPAQLPATVSARLATAAQRVFAALGVTGYGRADFRVTPDGEVVFLEMNPLPSLTLATGHDELYVAAARRGLSPRELIAAILDAAAALRPLARAG